MAGDWIKMRCELQTHPKIVRILSATKTDKFRVIGGLHAVWSVFDAHSKDGSLFGYTPDTLDHVIGWAGLSEALLLVGWLSFDGVETLTLPEFDEHNSKSAKRRAEDQKRKRDDRKCPQIVHDECGQTSDKMQTREEKRREDIDITHTTYAMSSPPVMPDKIPYAKIIDLYHEVLPTLPKCEKLTTKRRGYIAARWKAGDLPDLDEWRDYFVYVGKSPFLMGKADPVNGFKRFVANIEWLSNESNFTKVLEGKYHGSR